MTLIPPEYFCIPTIILSTKRLLNLQYKRNKTSKNIKFSVEFQFILFIKMFDGYVFVDKIPKNDSAVSIFLCKLSKNRVNVMF